MTVGRLATMIVSASFGGLGMFLLWASADAWMHGWIAMPFLFRIAAALLLLAAVIPLATDE